MPRTSNTCVASPRYALVIILRNISRLNDVHINHHINDHSIIPHIFPIVWPIETTETYMFQ